MITAEIARTQTRQALEDILDKKILDASKNCLSSITISKSDLPEWLLTRIRASGYKVASNPNNEYVISWEDSND